MFHSKHTVICCDPAVHGPRLVRLETAATEAPRKRPGSATEGGRTPSGRAAAHLGRRAAQGGDGDHLRLLHPARGRGAAGGDRGLRVTAAWRAPGAGRPAELAREGGGTLGWLRGAAGMAAWCCLRARSPAPAAAQPAPLAGKDVTLCRGRAGKGGRRAGRRRGAAGMAEFVFVPRIIF
eukprot:gene15873-biopygen6710